MLSIENTHRWAKAGVMIRATTAPDSMHVMVIVSPGKGIAMQYRNASGGASAGFTPVPGGAPVWVRLTRVGTLFIGWYTLDGHTWREIGRVEMDMPLTAAKAGLAVTSHDNTVLATAAFDDVIFVSP